MDTESKEQLNTIIDTFVDNKPEQAQLHFHDYLATRIQNIISVNQTNNDKGTEQ